MGKKADDTAETMRIMRRLTVGTLVGYMALVILFSFLAGDQLLFRESRGNFDLPEANSGTLELTAGNYVEEHFTTAIQRLEQIDVQWGTYYRPNSGTVVMDLFDLRNGSIVLSQSFDAAAIPEAGVTTLEAETPLEGLSHVPLMLRVSSQDCQPGSAPSPLMNAQGILEGGHLYLNGAPADGLLCFAVRGTDYIWTGLHYWEFAAAGAVLLLIGLGILWVRLRHGRRSYLVNAVIALERYHFLIRQLVSRDFKTKYKRSVLGMFWSFLNPLLMMCVQYFVFSTIFKSDIPNYAVYLLIGIVTFNFFSEASSMALSSIVGNASLITKVYMPKYIYPLTRVMSSVVNFGISLAPLVIVSLLTGVHFKKSVFLSLFFFCCVIVFSMGFGLFLSAAMVFFRDVQFLWGVLSMIWMYATPIFYPETILPEDFRSVLWLNPMYHFLKNIRICILDGISPEPTVYMLCAFIALGVLAVGAFVFRKTQDRFVLYL